MHTETGRKLARERHAFMEQFLNQFYKRMAYIKKALRQIGLMSPNIEITTLGCLISFIVETNSREVIIIRLRKLS